MHWPSNTKGQYNSSYYYWAFIIIQNLFKALYANYYFNFDNSEFLIYFIGKKFEGEKLNELE